MAQEEFLRFLVAARDDGAVLARYNRRNIGQMLFHAKNDGFDFNLGDVQQVAGKLEANVLLNKDGDPFDETARLWREMWGLYHLEYIVTRVVARHTDEELKAVVSAQAEA